MATKNEKPTKTPQFVRRQLSLEELRLVSGAKGGASPSMEGGGGQ